MGDFLKGLGTEKGAIKNIKLEGVGGVLQQFGTTIIQQLRKSITDKTKYDTLLGQSIAFTSKIFGMEYVFELSMNDYWRWVDEGRGASQKDEGGKVRKALAGIPGWIARRGMKLPETYSYK